MSRFVENSTDFSAACECQDGRCAVARENILFLDEGGDLAAVDRLQMDCGRVVIVPDESRSGSALLYHTSCQRMSNVVEQIFEGLLGEAVTLAQHASDELSLGEFRRRPVAISLADCRERVDRFDFVDESPD